MVEPSAPSRPEERCPKPTDTGQSSRIFGKISGEKLAWWLGGACCLLSALGYAAADGLVRDLLTRIDMYRILSIKETLSGLVIAAVGIPLMRRDRRLRRLSGRPVWPLARMVAWVLFAAFVCQVPGNFSQLWAYRQVGMAIAGPVSLGTTILFAALLGRVFLKERLAWPVILGILVLVLSVVLLGISGGTEDADSTVTKMATFPRTFSYLIAGVAAATLCGFSCAVVTAIIRFVGNHEVPVWLPGFIIPLAGLPASFPFVLRQYGLTSSIVSDISGHDWLFLIAAAVCNIVAFLAICRGIQLTSVVFGNVSGTIRLALVSVIGVFQFQEPGGILLTAGVLCACVGTLLIGSTPPIRLSSTDTTNTTENAP